MAHIIQGNPSYKISVDDIDLDYFYRNIHLPKNGLIKPLWTNIGYKQNEYYEFEVITDKKNNVDSEIYYDHNLICESYKCHICNINVPKMYQKEHNQTTKHKVYLEIADKSLERSRKHMNEEYNHQKSILRYDCYFCQSCCAAVATELKGYHEKTQSHLISVQQDDLLKELLKYYLDRDNIKIDFKLDKLKVLGNMNQINNTDSDDNESKLKQKVDQGPNVVSNVSTVKMEVIDNTVKNSIDNVGNKSSNFNMAQCEANKSITSEDNTETTVNTNLKSCEVQTLIKDNIENIEVNETMVNNNINEAALEDSNNKKTESDQVELTITKKRKRKKVKVDIAEVLKRYYDQISLGHKVKLIGDDLLEIKPIKGDIVRVAVENFHAYKELDGKMRCNLCNIVIDDVIESHMFSENHMIFAMAPISDQNCVRKCKVYYSHCILCNEVVQDAETHIFNNKNHNINLKKALVANETPAESDIFTIVYQNSPGKTYCEICEVYIGSDNFESHSNSKRHCENYDKKYPSLHNSNTVKNIIHKQNNNDLLPETNNPNEMTCKICRVQVPTKNMNQHLKGNRHEINYNSVLFENKMQICDNGHYCDVCKVNVPMDNLVDHIELREHVSSLNKLMALAFNDHFELVGPNESHIHCRVCEVTVAYELPTIDEHVASDKHQNNFDDLLEENHIIHVGDLNEYYCLHCNELLSENEISHINSSEHIYANTKLKKDSSSDNTIKIHPHMQTTANDKQLKCKVCLIPISSLSSSIEEHVKGKNHIKNYNKILEKLKKIDEQYFCEKCNVFLKDHLIVDHSCEENKKEKIETNSDSKEFKLDRDKPMPDGHIPCKICKVSFPNDPKIVEKHNNSESHLENCSKIMKYNRFVDNEDNYFFELSTVSESMCSNSSPVTMNNVKKIHPASSEVINSQEPPNVSEIQVPETSKPTILHEHMEDIGQPASVHCKVCSVPVPNNTHCVDIHVKGLKHKNKYDTLMKDNKLTERPNCFYCVFCEILISKNVDIEHVFSEEHKMKMVATTDAPTQITSVPLIHYLMEEIEQTGYLQCKLCKVDIVDQPRYVKHHLESPSHTAIYDEFIEKNRLVLRDDDTYLCKFCNELLAKNTEYEHVVSKKHKNSVAPNKYMCNVCNVAVPNNQKNIEEHLRGTLHQTKLSLTSDLSN